MRSTMFWGEFGEVVIRRLVRPEPGQPLLIIADTSTDMHLVEACFAAGVRAGADTQVLIKARAPRHAASNLGPAIAGAIRGSKLILVLGGGIVRDPATLEALENGARLLSTNVNGIEDYCLRALLDVDIDAMNRNSELVAKLWDETKVCHVTSPQGTDLTYELMPRKSVIGDGALSYDGEIDFFPGAQVNIAPVEESINGVIVVDASDSISGLVHTPYTMRMERGHIVRVEGGSEGESVRDWLATVGAKDDKVYRLCHASIGMNPQAGISGNLLEDERKLASLDLGFGFQYPALGGIIGFSPYHWDIMMSTPTIYLDGKEMSGNARLNPEMGFEPM
jgi:leucyl aminopeptidase (aminopeptidase T)